MTADGRGDSYGTNGAPVDLSTFNGGVEMEDGYAGGGTWRNGLADEKELKMCSAGGCVMVLMFLCA